MRVNFAVNHGGRKLGTEGGVHLIKGVSLLWGLLSTGFTVAPSIELS